MLNSLFVRHVYVICLWKAVFVCMYSRFYIILIIFHEFNYKKNITRVSWLFYIYHHNSESTPVAANSYPISAPAEIENESVVSKPGLDWNRFSIAVHTTSWLLKLEWDRWRCILKDIGLDGRILLKRIFKKVGCRVHSHLSGSGPVEGYSEKR